MVTLNHRMFALMMKFKVKFFDFYKKYQSDGVFLAIIFLITK